MKNTADNTQLMRVAVAQGMAAWGNSREEHFKPEARNENLECNKTQPYTSSLATATPPTPAPVSGTDDVLQLSDTCASVAQLLLQVAHLVGCGEEEDKQVALLEMIF